MTPNWNMLASADDKQILDELYRLGRADSHIAIGSVSASAALLQHSNPEIRERALFVFGIKAKCTELCLEYQDVVLNAAPEDWDVVAAGLRAMKASGCSGFSKNLIGRLVAFLRDDAVSGDIGSLIYAWLRFHAGKIDEEEYTRETLAKAIVDSEKLDELEQILNSLEMI